MWLESELSSSWHHLCKNCVGMILLCTAAGNNAIFFMEYRTRAMLDRGLYCFTACFLLLFHLKNKIKTHLIYENKLGVVYIRERVNMALVRYFNFAFSFMYWPCFCFLSLLLNMIMVNKGQLLHNKYNRKKNLSWGPCELTLDAVKIIMVPSFSTYFC